MREIVYYCYCEDADIKNTMGNSYEKDKNRMFVLSY